MRRRPLLFATFILLFAALAAPLRADLSTEVASALRAADLGSAAQTAIYVVDLDANQELVALDADRALLPASNMKLLTSAAASSILGPDFMFRTELRWLNNDPANASLLILGDGDPGFGDDKLLQEHGLDVEKLLNLWVRAVTGAGIKHIAQLVIDDRVFDHQMVHPAWPAGQLNSWYSAQVAGINFYDNCLDIFPAPESSGRVRIDILPVAPFLTFLNRAQAGPDGRDPLLINRKVGTNEITVTGRLATRSLTPINITIHDPPVFFTQVLSHRLAQAGITVDQIARIDAGAVTPAGKLLHVVQTSLEAVLRRANKDSQNLFAESLIKRIGRTASGKPGSWENGSAVLALFLQRQVGDRARGVVISDGSGLSRENRVTARALVSVLAAMKRDPRLNQVYFNSLSIAGKDGTLKDRLDETLAGRVYGKTGYISGVSSMSGYLLLAPAVGGTIGGNVPPRTVAFSFLFNDFKDLTAVRQLQERLLLMLDRSLSPMALPVVGR